MLDLCGVLRFSINEFQGCSWDLLLSANVHVPKESVTVSAVFGSVGVSCCPS